MPVYPVTLQVEKSMVTSVHLLLRMSQFTARQILSFTPSLPYWFSSSLVGVSIYGFFFITVRSINLRLSFFKTRKLLLRSDLHITHLSAHAMCRGQIYTLCNPSLSTDLAPFSVHPVVCSQNMTRFQSNLPD